RLEEGAAQDDVMPRVALPRAGRQRRPGAVLPFALGEGVEDALLGLGFGPTMVHRCASRSERRARMAGMKKPAPRGGRWCAPTIAIAERVRNCALLRVAQSRCT